MRSNLALTICRTFAVHPFRLLGRKFCPSSLVVPCQYYTDLKLTPEDISAGAKGIATLVLLGIVMVSWAWALAPLLYLSVALLIAYLLHGALIRCLPLRYAHERLTIEKYADLIINTLRLALLAGSTFDAIAFVAKSNFPIVSNEFERLLYRVNNNEPPETLLLEYARTQPSSTLRKHITTLFAANDMDTALQLLKDSTQYEARSAYDQFTLELDSRLTLAIGICTLLPLVVGLGLTMYGLASSPLILLTVPLHLALLHLLKQQLLTTHVELIG
jgi:hypothetical protein